MAEVVTPSIVTPVDKSGTITTGGTAQDVAAANTGRRGFWIQNNSNGALWVNEMGGTAAAAQPNVYLAPNGGFWSMDMTGVSASKISIYGATTGQAFSAREWTN